MLSANDKGILRGLAEEYMSYATLPVQKEKIALWKALNRSAMQRPMVTIDQLPWHELKCEELTCAVSDAYWRGVEDNLRKTIYKWKYFPVDMVLDPFVSIPKTIFRTSYGLVPKQETIGAEDSTAKSYKYFNQIVEMEDINKISDEQIFYDPDYTQEHLEQGEELFAGIAPVRATGIDFHLGVWDVLTYYMSAEECYYAFYDNPELLHAALERMTQSVIHGIEEANRLGVHHDNATLCHCSHIFTDELLPDSGAGKGAVSENCWAFGLAQVFTAVSPELFEEFELPYITRMAKYFGMIYYGCCDKLDDRLDIVKRIPNVRKVSCSPWSDRAHFAEQIGQSLIMSNKPSPAFLATRGFDEDAVRRDLEYTCELAKRNNVNLEFLLKDISTVKNEPDRLRRWPHIAMRVVEGF